jgi:hypothetical protein
MVSKSSDLGLANCPAILPNFTTGIPAPYIKTTAICSKTLYVSLTLSALNSLNDSAQSPPNKTNAFPFAALANWLCNFLDSPAKTSGGKSSMCLKTASISD